MRYPHYRWWSWTDVMIWVAFAFIAIGLTIVGVRDCNERDRCTENGGEVIEYNCHLVFAGKTVYEDCDWRCEGASAEDGR